MLLTLSSPDVVPGCEVVQHTSSWKTSTCCFVLGFLYRLIKRVITCWSVSCRAAGRTSWLAPSVCSLYAKLTAANCSSTFAVQTWEWCQFYHQTPNFPNVKFFLKEELIILAFLPFTGQNELLVFFLFLQSKTVMIIVIIISDAIWVTFQNVTSAMWEMYHLICQNRCWH